MEVGELHAAGGENHWRFEGAVGSFVVKLFDLSVVSAGINIETARKEGYDAIDAFVVQFDRAHFYPDKTMVHLALVVEKNTRRVLGIQGFGEKGDALVGRINAVAAILEDHPTIDRISNLELAYSPPFSSAMKKTPTGPTDTDNRSWTALKASIGSAEFVGVNNLTIAVKEQASREQKEAERVYRELRRSSGSRTLPSPSSAR